MALVALVTSVFALLFMTVVALDTLSGARAYIASENQWSKAEQSAVAHLLRYARTRDDSDYDVFLAELEVTLGDRRAREEMSRRRPNLDVVRNALLQGRNHPDDIDRMVAFFRRFHGVSRVARATDAWTRADHEIDTLIGIAAELRAVVLSGSADQAAISRVLAEIEASAARLGTHANNFSASMGAAARWAHRIILAIVAGSGVLIVFLSMFLLRRAARRTSASEMSALDSEKRKRAVVDTIEDGYWDIDLGGHVAFVNAGLCRILDRAAHEVVGHGLREFLHPDSADPAVKALSHVLRTGRSVRALSLIVLTGDGRARHVEASLSLVRGAGGNAVGFSGVARDVTERRVHEEALRRSEAEYRGLFEHSPYGIYRSTPDGRFLAVNSALVEMLGYESEAALLAADLGTEVYASSEERHRLIEAHHGKAIIWGVDVEWRRRDGSSILVRLNGRRIHDGEFDGFEMFVEDLTHRRALEGELRHAQKMQALGQLTGGIAHDFNNLLTIVAATADLLAGEVPASADTDIGELRAAADRGAEMVRKLLAFSRRGQLRFEPIDLDLVLADTMAMLRRVLPAHIEIDTDSNAPVFAHADKGAIEQVILNLATNARDAMPSGGRLHISTSTSTLDEAFCAAHGWAQPGSFATLTVTDTGSGMDANTLEHTFEPFFTTKAPGAGTGLGMAMVYGIVRQHDGYIDLKSEPGCGTVVRIYLPLAKAEPAPSRQEPPAHRPGGSETVLIVEDEPAILGMGRRILERRGYRVLTAADGEEAMAVLREAGAGVDLVLSDVVMPRMGGAALYRAARSEGLDVRFLFTSGYTPREVGDLLDPSLPLLAKPWSIDMLEQRVREALDNGAVPAGQA